jgi:predicted ABC-type sugar transport system permease subunit
MLYWLMADTRFPYVLAILLVVSGLLALWTGAMAAGRFLTGARAAGRRLVVTSVVLAGASAAAPFFGTGFAMAALAFDLLRPSFSM